MIQQFTFMTFHQTKQILIRTVINLFKDMDLCLKQEVISILAKVIYVDLHLVESNDIVLQAFLRKINYRIACNRLVGYKTDQQVFDIAVSGLEK